MSSLRNAVKRVTHKERSQPAARGKLGLLEKHKDYVERAKNYHKKQNYLTVLKKKAAERNPDEFYFKMNNSQVSSKGVHREKKDGSLDNSVVKLLKTQDLGYIVHKKAVDDRKISKIKGNLHMIGENTKSTKKHKVFVDDEDKVESFDPLIHYETTSDMVDHGHNRLKRSQIEDFVDNNSIPSAAVVKKLVDKRIKSYKELEQRSKRAHKLDNVLSELTHQRNMMGKGSKKKIGGSEDGKVQYKWKKRRLK